MTLERTGPVFLCSLSLVAVRRFVSAHTEERVRDQVKKCLCEGHSCEVG